MLVVKRRKEEILVIGEPPDEVRIKVVELSVDDWGKPQLRLGIEAPRHIRVDRGAAAAGAPLDSGTSDNGFS